MRFNRLLLSTTNNGPSVRRHDEIDDDQSPAPPAQRRRTSRVLVPSSPEPSLIPSSARTIATFAAEPPTAAEPAVNPLEAGNLRSVLQASHEAAIKAADDFVAQVLEEKAELQAELEAAQLEKERLQWTNCRLQAQKGHLQRLASAQQVRIRQLEEKASLVDNQKAHIVAQQAEIVEMETHIGVLAAFLPEAIDDYLSRNDEV